MIKVITYAKRNWSAIPPEEYTLESIPKTKMSEEHTISNEADLKTFFEDVIQNNSHCVYKVECPELNTSFDCTDPTWGIAFIPFARRHFNEK